MTRVRPRLLPIAIAALCSPGLSLAGELCDANRLQAEPASLSVRFDNDLLGQGGQDQGYSNGAIFTVVSPEAADLAHGGCFSRIAGWLSKRLDPRPAAAVDQRNMVFSFGQAIFTPKDWSRSDVVGNDRPYAAIVMGRIGYNVRRGDTLLTTQLQFGILGPLALGKEVQDAVHDAFEVERFSGWDHQLRNEPVVGVLHERMWRRQSAWIADSGLQWDVVTHWGGVIGNAFMHANGGVELRLGWSLPTDFGSSPLRPAGQNTAPGGLSDSERLSGHAFLTSDAKWVLRDITLDGNTFGSSHHVEKRSMVGEFGYGIVVQGGRWKIALAVYHRSREFGTQGDAPRFGSLTFTTTL